MNINNNLELVIFDLDDTLMFKYSQKMNIRSIDIVNYFRNLGVKIALCTLNKFGELFLYKNNIHHIFDNIQQNKFNDEYIDDEDRKNCKSNRKTYMYKKVLNILNIKAENTIIFDDCFVHIIEAKIMKIKYIHVDNKKCITWTNVKNGINLFKHTELNIKRCNSI